MEKAHLGREVGVISSQSVRQLEEVTQGCTRHASDRQRVVFGKGAAGPDRGFPVKDPVCLWPSLYVNPLWFPFLIFAMEK